MKKLLILFSNGYPYGNSEPFLENEVPLYKEYFDKVLIVTSCKKGDNPTRKVDDAAIEVLPDYTLTWHLPSVLSAVPRMLTDGKAYLENRYGAVGKVSVHRLGAMDRGLENPSGHREILRIVTCSRTIPLKRLDRLVDALSRIDRSIHWLHIGGGESQEKLERYAAEKLPENITAEFTGTVPNTKIYDLYSSRSFHVFVNISETEGLPVAIMEAMSFHIPVIATAVGGTPELIAEGKNGYLLDADFSDEELAERISRFADMPEAEYQSFRQAARETYACQYDAIENYRRFLRYLSKQGKENDNRAPLKTPFRQSARSFAPTFAYKNLEIHTVFLRFLTQNLKQNS